MATESFSMKFGQGRISGVLSITLGLLSLLGVLCFHFPEYLTTPELRQNYDVETLRWVMQISMMLALVLGVIPFILGQSRRLGMIGIFLTLITFYFGGATVEVADFDSPKISFGLDWFIIALLSNSLVFIFLERLFPHDKKQLVFRKEWKLDLTYYFFNHLMISVALIVTTLFSEKLFGWAVNASLQEMIRSQPLWLQFIEVLVAADFMQYWGHRMMHENKYLWNFHAVHHCPAQMDWLSGSRQHFFEVLFTRSIVLLPIYLLGFSESAVNAYIIFVGVQAVLNHANVDIPFGPLKYIFVTPHFHHWHHSADEEAIDKNYAAHVPILDMMFGSYIANHDRWPEKYGVVGKPLPRGFLMQHLYPFTNPKKEQE